MEWSIDFHEMLYAVYSRFWIILFCVIGSLAIAVWHLKSTPPVYQATATVQVESTEGKIVKIEEIGATDTKEDSFIKTIEQKFRRYDLAFKVAQDLRLSERPFFTSWGNKDNDATYVKIAEHILRSINVKLRRETRLIDISVDMLDPALAQEIANGLVSEFMKEEIQERVEASQAAYGFLVMEAERLKANLSKSELILQEYESALSLKEHILKQEMMMKALSHRYMDEHPKMIQERNFLLELRKNFVLEIQRISQSRDEKTFLLDESQILSDEKFSKIVQQAEGKLKILDRDVETDRTIYQAILQRLKETDITKSLETVNIKFVERASLPQRPYKPQKFRTLLIGALGGSGLGIMLAFILNVFDSSFKTVETAQRYLGLPVLGLIPRVRQFDVLKHNPATLAGLLWKFQKIVITLRKNIFKQTESEDDPFKKVVEDFRNSLHQNARAWFKLPPLPAVEQEIEEGSQITHFLVLAHSTDASIPESFRTLCTRLNLTQKKQLDRPSQSYLFTSAIPFEGKSFVACNLALAQAQRNAITLLIDGDLRHPTVHSYFKKDRKQHGLGDYLEEKKHWKAILTTTFMSNLYLITAGQFQENPIELFRTQKFQSLLQEASAYFQQIIISGPPVTSASETLFMASSVNDICMVVDVFRTPRKLVKHVRDQLVEANGRIVGIVLNRIVNRGKHYDPYYYYYNTHYGQVREKHLRKSPSDMEIIQV
ncbi:MAG: polysaccharide biosynthesis tyrosine autokinase [Verrucomicrobiota bacterium]